MQYRQINIENESTSDSVASMVDAGLCITSPSLESILLVTEQNLLQPTMPWRVSKLASFPGLRPDFISQPWRKIWAEAWEQGYE